MRQFGVLIDQVSLQRDLVHNAHWYDYQSYPDTLGTPGNGVMLSVSISRYALVALTDAFQDVNFIGSENSFTVNSDAQRVAVNCGSGSCSGNVSTPPIGQAR